MSRTAPSVPDLREVRDRLALSPIEADRRVAHALASVLNGAEPKEALGLKPAPGRRSPLRAQLDRDRNHLIRQLAEAHLSHLALGQQATEIVVLARRYESGLGRHDKFRAKAPASYAGTPRSLLFEIARIGARVPDRRRVIDILAECSELGVFAANDIDESSFETGGIDDEQGPALG